VIKIQTYLFFEGRCEEAFEFYKATPFHTLAKELKFYFLWAQTVKMRLTTLPIEQNQLAEPYL
jgi:uncharacterized glyoxalase superfamily protein PhnB